MKTAKTTKTTSTTKRRQTRKSPGKATKARRTWPRQKKATPQQQIFRLTSGTTTFEATVTI